MSADGDSVIWPRTHADKSCEGNFPLTLNVPIRILQIHGDQDRRTGKRGMRRGVLELCLLSNSKKFILHLPTKPVLTNRLDVGEITPG